jgi:GT2 family glycosyltransferase
MDLSIILPTCNRARLLEKALAAIEAQTACSHEIIVVDGASSDDTQHVLAEARHDIGDRLRVITEEKREGFVKAVNKGFKEARGKNMTWINDDARPICNALDRAVAQLDAEPSDVGFVAMFHCWNSPRNVAYETWYRNHVYRLCHVRGTLYANFPVGRRETYEKLGWFDERYFLNAADPDLSLKAWHASLKVVPAYGAMIDHDEIADIRRVVDTEQAREDNDKLFEKWDLPPKNPLSSEFDPQSPCTLRGLRSAIAEAA